MSVIRGYILPGLPQPLLCPEASLGYARLRTAFDVVREEIAQSDADVLILYSTMWPSVIGHQILSRPNPQWTHVDEQFHDLGSIPYSFRIDSELAHLYSKKAMARGLMTRTVDYHGFPIDTGSVVALKLINPENRIPAIVLSSNVYADRAETVVFAKAAKEALAESGKKAIAVSITTLSNRLHQEWISPEKDCIHSQKDEEWNQKILEFLRAGRLEDVAQLSRQIHREARVHKVNNFKSMWWMASLMGAHNRYTGTVHAYEPVYGTGCAVVGLAHAAQAARDLEFDESSPEYFTGDRNVLAPSISMGMSSQSPDPGQEGGA
jgi:2-aminophenol/2-amino-5-chlorophenol 1,6-dioxygenase alpha subunit